MARISEGAGTDQSLRWEAELAEDAHLTGLRDLRLEAWRASAWGTSVDPRYDAPFATAPVDRDGRQLSGVIATNREPDVERWILALTGVDDGVRYVVDASSSGLGTFHGSAWDWIVAVIDDR